MADAQLTPQTSSPLSAATSAITGIAKREREEEGQLDTASQAEQQDISGIEQRTDEGISRLDTQASGLVQPAPFKPTPPPTVQPTDPKQIWGSAAMFIAAFGGLLTRQPMATALNAAAGVMKAYQAGDQAAANQAFQTWKISNENALNAASAEQKSYDEALAGIDRHINALDREGASQIRAAVAKFQGVAAAYHNDQMLQAAQTNDIRTILGMNEDYGLKISQAEEAAGKAAIEHDYLQARTKLLADPKFQQLMKTDHVKAYKELMDLTPQSMRPMTEDQQLSKEAEMRKELDSGKVGSDGATYDQVKSGLPYILSLTNSDAVRNGTIKQSIQMDVIVRFFNGGRAIRAFNQKLFTDNAGLLDRADRWEHMLEAGAHISGMQVQDLINAARIYAQKTNQIMAADVHRAQADAMSAGLDPVRILPFAYDPNIIPDALNQYPGVGGAARPTPKAIDTLRAHPNDPTYRQSFDKYFGPGAAEKVLGQ